MDIQVLGFIVRFRRLFREKLKDSEFKELTKYFWSESVEREVIIAFERACLDSLLDEAEREDEETPVTLSAEEVERYLAELNRRNAERLKKEDEDTVS